MIKGLYTAGSGMMLQLVRQDAVANNLANVSTSGYKKDIVVSTSFPGMLMSRLGEKDPGVNAPYEIIGPLPTGASMSGVFTDHAQGNIQKTDSPLDAAIFGEGYYVVNTPQGERFTRDGQMSINSENVLVNKQGLPYLDENDQTIVINREINRDYRGDISISNRGEIYLDNERITRLKVVNFEDPGTLRKIGNNLMTAGNPYTIMDRPEIKQGFMETSNVNPISEMVSLISITRAYEAMQKMVQAEDDAMGTVINSVGSVN